MRTIFHGDFPDDIKPLVFTMIRRASMAVIEYQSGPIALIEYLSGPRGQHTSRRTFKPYITSRCPFRLLGRSKELLINATQGERIRTKIETPRLSGCT
jgi:hypothetical protein